ncbi:MAG TPA: cytochrome P460 family protein [Kofleriaceae bacterium]|nr:cytochrome P460 family protein [Kofleriaceae bacterium]
MHWIESARVAAVVAISLAASATVHAGGDPAAGLRKGIGCAACHASSDPAIDTPRLAGQNAGYLARQLRAFRGGERAHPLMDEITRQMTDTDIDDLAAFWSHQPVGSDSAVPPEARAIRTSHVQFPREFPRGFVLYLTLNDAEHALVKQHYINTIGLEAARAGKPLPDGTVVLQVIYRARLGPDGQPATDRQGAWTTDRIESYTAMESRAGWGQDLPEWLRNARWSYAKFTPGKLPSSDANQAMCLACHRRQALVSYVFTFNELRDAAHAH